MRTRATTVGLACAALLVSSACNGSAGGGPPPYWELRARAGVYQDGSGRQGLAVLATLRDPEGAGPSAPWSASVSDETGTIALADYESAGAGSYSAWWWPDVAVREGVRYTLRLTDGTQSISAAMEPPPAAGLALAAPSLSADASLVGWSAVEGAASYRCRVYEATALQLDTISSVPGCDVSALPPGGYSASILATSADLTQIASSTSQAPVLPPSFDVSESRISFVRPEEGGTALELLAAGGALDYGTSERGLAVWVSIHEPGGTPTSKAWTVSVTGPGISPSAPATFEYSANLPRKMAWSYDIPATPGTYSLSATSGSTGLAATFDVGYPTSLPFVVDEVATAGTSGSAQVTWTPVEGAHAYLVEVRDHADLAHVTSMWVAAPPALFPQNTFTSGRTYDAWVAATDADMSGGAVPTQVSVSEYPFIHASFTE